MRPIAGRTQRTTAVAAILRHLPAAERRKTISHERSNSTMTGRIAWHRTHREQLDLLSAVIRHCTCRIGFDGTKLAVCPPHCMLIEHQRVLDGLLFARRLTERLEAEEQRAA
jgi:hypothetical protein